MSEGNHASAANNQYFTYYAYKKYLSRLLFHLNKGYFMVKLGAY
jgi:hypothetical protein